MLINAASLLTVVLAARALPHDGTSSDGIPLYVAPNGDDAWSGNVDVPNSSATDGPLATVAAARDRVRACRAERPASPITVYLRQGAYFLDEPLTFGPEDSGSEAAPVTYAAYPGESPVLSGGVRIANWQTTEMGGRTVWTAHLPEFAGDDRRIRQLFVNGERRRCARMPNDGWFTIEALPDVDDQTPWSEGQTRFKYAKGDLSAWDDAGEGDVVALHSWVDSHLPIADVDEEQRLVTLGKRSIFRLFGDHSASGADYYVENLLEALDQPGEWCHHRKSGTLYYLPMPGERIDDVDAIVARHSVVVRFEGDPEAGHFVEHVTLRGLTVSHAEWWLGPQYDPKWSQPEVGGMVQAAYAVPGAVTMRGARNCAIEASTVSHVGTYAIEIGRGCRENAVRHCNMTDLGAGGVKTGETEIREVAGEQTHRNELTDNVIDGCGRLFHSGVGVWIGHSGANVVAHNDIRDLYYTGISVGWSWGYGRSLSAHNRIEYNHIHDVTSRGYGGWGIYPDEGTSHALIENNVVYRTNRAGFHLHYGKDNLIRNNVFEFGGEAQIVRSRPDPFVFRRNIVYWTDGPLLDGNWSEPNVTMDENLYFKTGDAPITPLDSSWDGWQASGMDVHSVIADPLFEDVDADDFRLRPASPAWRLGFEPIDVEAVGPRADS